MPLRNGSTRWCQHIGPMTKLGSTCVVTQHHFTNGFGSTNPVVVHYSYHQVDFLELRYESLESHKAKPVNLPVSAQKVLQTWKIRYSKGWECISWCWSSFSWVVCRFALKQFSRKDLYINFLFISVTVDSCKEFLPDSPPTSIFFKFFASRITTVNLPAVGTYLKEKQMSPNLLSCNRLR